MKQLSDKGDIGMNRHPDITIANDIEKFLFDIVRLNSLLLG